MLTELDYLPKGLLDIPVTALDQLIPVPTLIHLAGRRPQPLFVSVLVHGNETTGFLAMQQLLKNYRVGGGKQELPRALSLFIANVSAAKAGVRHLDKQPDYNRIWKTSPDTCPERRMAQRILEEMARRQVFASVDIHNNTGLNPHYACVNLLQPPFLHLATLFSRTVVYFTRPDSVQSIAFSKLCPAVTLECGQPGIAHGIRHAEEYINACLHLSQLPQHPVAEHDIDLFHTVATVKVSPRIDFDFGTGQAQLQFVSDLERMNFRELPAGTILGRLNAAPSEPAGIPLDVIDESGKENSLHYFELKNNTLCLRQPVMPAMLTTDSGIVRQDCLCYLMERYRI